MKRVVVTAIVLAAIAALWTLVMVVVLSPRTDTGYEFSPGNNWTKTVITNGHEYKSPTGQVISVRVFEDPLMDQDVLFSRQTRNNIRANYEETYIVDDDRVYFSELDIEDRKALVVRFADRSSGSLVHKRQYYLVDGHTVYLITGTLTETVTQALLDNQVRGFRIL